MAGSFGKEYEWHTTIIRARWWQFRLWHSVRFVGAMKFDNAYRAPLRRALRAEGFTKLLWTRIDPKTFKQRHVEMKDHVLN